MFLALLSIFIIMDSCNILLDHESTEFYKDIFKILSNSISPGALSQVIEILRELSINSWRLLFEIGENDEGDFKEKFMTC